jgi:hypothetical protein
LQPAHARVLFLDEVDDLEPAGGALGPGALAGGENGEEPEKRGGERDRRTDRRSHGGIIGPAEEEIAVPKSKSKRTTYQPPPKKKPKASPPWFAPVVLIVLLAGVAVIVLNYMGLIPGTSGATNLYLWIGLGMIALGFAAATQLR